MESHLKCHRNRLGDDAWAAETDLRRLHVDVAVFGADVEARAERLFPDDTPVVWECDAVSFKFDYVGRRAEELLGFTSAAWLEPMFWAMQVVHEQDRDDAVNYCALATKKMRDHMFEYRAVAVDGRTLWFADYVKVVRGADGKPERLRGALVLRVARRSMA